MKNRGLQYGPFDRLLPVAIAAIFVMAVLLLHLRSAGAQVANVRISELVCDEDPEVVVIMNEGNQEIDMASWRLQSDPISDESLTLFLVGTLSPGESVLIQNGPSATGAFIWSREFAFRDGDPTDFAELVDAAGEVVERVNCPVQQPSVTATPVQTLAPQPSPTPTALPADAVPFGGGPPTAGVGFIPPAAMIVAGSWLLTAGLGTFAVPLLHRGRRSDPLHREPLMAPSDARELRAEEADLPDPRAQVQTESCEPAVTAVPPPREPVYSTEARIAQIHANNPLPRYLALVVVVIVFAAVRMFRLQGGARKRE